MFDRFKKNAIPYSLYCIPYALLLFRKRHAKGLELDRAKGGVSFLYDEPPTFERYSEMRDKVHISN